MHKKILTGLLALTTCVFLQTLWFDFAGFDDQLLLTLNPIAQGLSIDNIVAAFSSYDPELYIPITLLSYQIEHSIAGLHPWIYHTTNLTLHLLSVALVFRIFHILAKTVASDDDALWIGATVSAFFALHPLAVQTVAWAAARKDILSAFLLLLSIFLFLRSKEGSRKAYFWSIACFGLGLGAKVSIVLAPVVLLLINELYREPRTKRTIMPLVPYGILSMIFGIIALGGKQQQLSYLSLLDTILLGAKSAFFYVQTFLFPKDLALFYHFNGVIDPLSPAFLAPILFCVALLLCGMLCYKHYRFVSFGIFFYAFLLLPTFFNFWKNGFIDIASDRYAYVALSGLVFVGAILVVPRMKYRTAIGSVLALLLAGMSFVQTQIWSDSETLLRATLRSYPDSTHALVNLGTTMYEKGNPEASIALYDEAIRIDPSLSPAYLNKARVLTKIGNISEALTVAEKSVSVIPDDRTTTPDELQAFFFLGSLYEQRGDLTKSLNAFKNAVTLAPENEITLFNLGVMYQKYGNTKGAQEAFHTAYGVAPRFLENRYRLAAVEAELGNFSAAIEHLEYIIKKDSDYQQAQKHLQSLRLLQ